VSPRGTLRGTPLRSQNATFDKNFYPSRLEHLAALVRIHYKSEEPEVVKFLLWCILLVLCWPLALLALVVCPFVWLVLLPFRVMGIAVRGALVLVWSIVTLPAKLLRGF
jgi:hypothetical protein